MSVDYQLLITDSSLNAVGVPIVDWESIDVTLKYNEPGSGLFVVANNADINAMIAAGNRVVVIRTLGPEYDNASSVLISGPIEDILKERSDDGENAGSGKITVHFADDLSRIVARQAYPDPTVTPENQMTDRWQFTGNSETALRNLVDQNAGPGALAARQVPQLALGATASVGTTVTVDADRMHPMGDLMRQIADTGGSIGFRTRQSGTQIMFEVYQPPDKSRQVFFGFGLGNMKYLSHQVSAPKSTTAIVGGQGEGSDRYLIERNNTTDEAVWGRSETLVSRPGSRPVQELQDDGDKQLADDASTTRVTADVADVPDQKFGVHYFLGDIVSIETDPGVMVSDKVVTVHIQAFNSAGEYVSPTVGSQAAQTDPHWVQVTNAINERLGQLERVVKPAVLP